MKSELGTLYLNENPTSPLLKIISASKNQIKIKKKGRVNKMKEKKIAIIGIGNCGSQVAYLAEKDYPDMVDPIYFNTSETDLSTVEGSMKFKIGDVDEVEGSGKNRSKMKEYLLGEIENILKDEKFVDLIVEKKYVFIVASTAGGTGSGSAPALLDILRNFFPDVNFILVAVLPQLQASLMEHGNTIEFLDELYTELGDNTTYMIYDNETTADRSPTESLEIVNKAIVEDIRVLSGVDNFPTKYDSIDDADMESIISTSGRLLVVRVESGLTEKNMEDNLIDDILIKGIKKSCHAETDRNKRVVRWGIITYFTDEVNKLYSNAFDKVREFIGTPIERFNHNAVNNGKEDHNFLYMIASGLSPINDRSKKISAKIEELKNALAKDDSSKYVLSGESVAYDAAEERKREQIERKQKEGIKPKDIMKKYMKK